MTLVVALRRLALSGLLAVAASCTSPKDEAPSSSASSPRPFPFTRGRSALFQNGNFEDGTLNGWTVQTLKNTSGLSVVPPTTVANLNLSGTSINKTRVVTGDNQTVVPAGLTAASSLRIPPYGRNTAVVNELGLNQNANVIRQSYAATAADVDPADGKIHVRFVLAPVLQNPGHDPEDQPYFFLQVSNTTKGTILFTSFNFANQPGIPWKTEGGVQYTDWQVIDVAPGMAGLAIGDTVKIEAYAVGCQPGGHWGHIYLDAAGAFLPALSVAADGPDSANAGDQFTYTYLVKNGSPAAVGNVVFTSVLPAGTRFVSVNPPGGASCTTPAVGATGTVSCNLGSMNASTSQDVELVVSIPNGTSGTINHGNYSVEGDGVLKLLGPLVTTNVTNGVTYADLEATITDGKAAVGWGSPVQYTLTLANKGPNAVLGAPVTFNLPGELTGATWTCSATGGGSCAAPSGSGNINQTVDLAPGETATYIIDATVVSGSGSATMTATATVSAPAGVTDNEAGNNTAADIDRVGTLHVLTVTKSPTDPGTVVSSPAAINCGVGCASASADFLDGDQVSLTATGSGTASFASWSGGCSGNDSPCNLTLTADTIVNATFGYGASVTVVGSGSATCDPPVPSGGTVNCTFTPAAGWQLAALTDDGSDVFSSVSGGVYTLNNVTQGHILVATFKGSNGTNCGSTNSCVSGQCTDGVCCDTACTGQCEACDVTGSVGTCTLVTGAVHGSRTACTNAGTTCGGSCNGSSTTCVFPGGSTSCRAASCSGATHIGETFCDGAGTCPPIQTTSCSNYACTVSGCESSCAADTQCNTGRYCAGGTCVVKKANGQTCSADSQCTSGQCTDGVCCNSACEGQCEACDVSGSVGTCTPVAGAPHGGRTACLSDGSACGGTCDGVVRNNCAYPGATTACRGASCAVGTATLPAYCNTTGSCPSVQTQSCGTAGCQGVRCKGDCVTAGDCGNGNYCSGGVCAPKLPAGVACGGPNQCATGQCVDGVCCDTACTGQCQACNVTGSVGTCSPVTGAPKNGRPACESDGSACGGSCNGSLGTACTYPGSSTSCRGASCNTGTGSATLAAACDGAGHCPAEQTQVCPSNACTGGICAGGCTTDAGCAGGQFCSAGVCVAKKSNGSVCSASAQCTSGQCVDGVCCNSACAGQCQACDKAGSVGTCSAISGAPHGNRTACADDGSSCGGTCDGTLGTACTYPTAGTACRTAACANDAATLGTSCDSAGHCGPRQEQNCQPYVCGPTACLGNCSADADCSVDNYCSAGVCVPKLPAGQACAGGNQCGSNQCVDGVCCNTACEGQCEACDVAGSVGSCVAVSGAPHGGRPACATDRSVCGSQCTGQSRTACGELDSATCKGVCTTDDDCTDGNYCFGGECRPKGNTGDFVALGSGGCSSTPDGGPFTWAPWLLAMIALGATRARRRLHRIVMALGLLAMTLPLNAQAQTAAPNDVNLSFAVNRFLPLGGGNDVLGVQSTEVIPHLTLSAGIWGNYASKPLRLFAPERPDLSFTLLRSQSVVDLVLSLGLWNRFELSLALPYTFSQTSNQAGMISPNLANPVAGSGLSDLRIAPKILLLNGSRFQLGLSVPLTIPVGRDDSYLSHGSVTAAPRILAELKGPIGMRWLGNLGMALRQQRQFVNLKVGNAIQYGLGAELPFHIGKAAFAALASVQGESELAGSGEVGYPIEALGAIRWMILKQLGFTVGAGRGLTDGYGAPAYRIIAGLGYLPGRIPRNGKKESPPAAPEPPPEPIAEVVPPVITEEPAAAPEPPPPEEPPPPPPVSVDQGRLVLTEPIHFETAKAQIKSDSHAILDRVAQVLAENPAITRMRIEGHTDNRGSAAFNTQLSMRRARAVEAYLVKKGIEEARLEPKGFGPTRPAFPNDTENGRARNRRVDFVILEGPGKTPAEP